MCCLRNFSAKKLSFYLLLALSQFPPRDFEKHLRQRFSNMEIGSVIPPAKSLEDQISKIQKKPLDLIFEVPGLLASGPKDRITPKLLFIPGISGNQRGFPWVQQGKYWVWMGAEPYMSTTSQWGHPRSIAFPVKPFLFVAIDLSWVICHLTIWFVFLHGWTSRFF